MPDLEDVKPLAVWEDNDSLHDDLVWWTRFDKRYQIEVHRIGKCKGILCIFDHDSKDALLYIEEVVLSYDALFGPDIIDIREWQEKVVEFVDNL